MVVSATATFQDELSSEEQEKIKEQYCMAVARIQNSYYANCDPTGTPNQCDCDAESCDYPDIMWWNMDRVIADGDNEHYGSYTVTPCESNEVISADCETTQGVKWDQTGDTFRLECSKEGIQCASECKHDYRVRFMCSVKDPNAIGPTCTITKQGTGRRHLLTTSYALSAEILAHDSHRMADLSESLKQGQGAIAEQFIEGVQENLNITLDKDAFAVTVIVPEFSWISYDNAEIFSWQVVEAGLPVRSKLFGDSMRAEQWLKIATTIMQHMYIDGVELTTFLREQAPQDLTHYLDLFIEVLSIYSEKEIYSDTNHVHRVLLELVQLVNERPSTTPHWGKIIQLYSHFKSELPDGYAVEYFVSATQNDIGIMPSGDINLEPKDIYTILTKNWLRNPDETLQMLKQDYDSSDFGVVKTNLWQFVDAFVTIVQPKLGAEEFERFLEQLVVEVTPANTPLDIALNIGVLYDELINLNVLPQKPFEDVLRELGFHKALNSTNPEFVLPSVRVLEQIAYSPYLLKHSLTSRGGLASAFARTLESINSKLDSESPGLSRTKDAISQVLLKLTHATLEHITGMLGKNGTLRAETVQIMPFIKIAMVLNDNLLPTNSMLIKTNLNKITLLLSDREWGLTGERRAHSHVTLAPCALVQLFDPSGTDAGEFDNMPVGTLLEILETQTRAAELAFGAECQLPKELLTGKHVKEVAKRLRGKLPMGESPIPAMELVLSAFEWLYAAAAQGSVNLLVDQLEESLSAMFLIDPQSNSATFGEVNAEYNGNIAALGVAIGRHGDYFSVGKVFGVIVAELHLFKRRVGVNDYTTADEIIAESNRIAALVQEVWGGVPDTKSSFLLPLLTSTFDTVFNSNIMVAEQDPFLNAYEVYLDLMTGIYKLPLRTKDEVKEAGKPYRNLGSSVVTEALANTEERDRVDEAIEGALENQIVPISLLDMLQVFERATFTMTNDMHSPIKKLLASDDNWNKIINTQDKAAAIRLQMSMAGCLKKILQSLFEGEERGEQLFRNFIASSSFIKMATLAAKPSEPSELSEDFSLESDRLEVEFWRLLASAAHAYMQMTEEKYASTDDEFTAKDVNATKAVATKSVSALLVIIRKANPGFALLSMAEDHNLKPEMSRMDPPPPHIPSGQVMKEIMRGVATRHSELISEDWSLRVELAHSCMLLVGPRGNVASQIHYNQMSVAGGCPGKPQRVCTRDGCEFNGTVCRAQNNYAEACKNSFPVDDHWEDRYVNFPCPLAHAVLKSVHVPNAVQVADIPNILSMIKEATMCAFTSASVLNNRFYDLAPNRTLVAETVSRALQLSEQIPPEYMSMVHEIWILLAFAGGSVDFSVQGSSLQYMGEMDSAAGQIFSSIYSKSDQKVEEQLKEVLEDLETNENNETDAADGMQELVDLVEETLKDRDEVLIEGEGTSLYGTNNVSRGTSVTFDDGQSVILGTIQGAEQVIIVTLDNNTYASFEVETASENLDFEAASGVMSVNVNGADGELSDIELENPIEIDFKLDDDLANVSVEELICAWWNEETDQWSTKGCAMIEDKGRKVCMCCHLTDFCVLKKMGNEKIGTTTNTIERETGEMIPMKDSNGTYTCQAVKEKIQEAVLNLEAIGAFEANGYQHLFSIIGGVILLGIASWQIYVRRKENNFTKKLVAWVVFASVFFQIWGILLVWLIEIRAILTYDEETGELVTTGYQALLTIVSFLPTLFNFALYFLIIYIWMNVLNSANGGGQKEKQARVVFASLMVLIALIIAIVVSLSVAFKGTEQSHQVAPAGLGVLVAVQLSLTVAICVYAVKIYNALNEKIDNVKDDSKSQVRKGLVLLKYALAFSLTFTLKSLVSVVSLIDMEFYLENTNVFKPILYMLEMIGLCLVLWMTRPRPNKIAHKNSSLNSDRGSTGRRSTTRSTTSDSKSAPAIKGHGSMKTKHVRKSTKSLKSKLSGKAMIVPSKNSTVRTPPLGPSTAGPF